MRRRRPNSQPPVKEPPEPCPFCGGDTKRSSKIVPETIVLKCLPCGKMGNKGSLASDWIAIADPRGVEWLVHVEEQRRRWVKMLVDPHVWTDAYGNDLDDYDD